MKFTNIILSERLFNSAVLLAVIGMLITAFFYQFVYHELPCPLCLLQRLGFLLVASGFLLNLRFGFRASHYSCALLAALFTAFVALRQVLLHIVPGSGSYGSAVFGLHMYTWSFIAAMLIIIATSVMLGVDRQYEKPNGFNHGWSLITHILFAIILFLIVANIISTFLLCGISTCPSNPTFYKLLQ